MKVHCYQSDLTSNLFTQFHQNLTHSNQDISGKNRTHTHTHTHTHIYTHTHTHTHTHTYTHVIYTQRDKVWKTPRATVSQTDGKVRLNFG